MKPFKIFCIIFLLVIYSYNNSAQTNIIAKIGNNELTKEEFKLRYELSPRILPDNLTNSDSLKLKFLYSLLSEKLWAIEALDKGLTNSEDYEFYYKPIEKIYVRDELFRIEIKDKIIVTDNELSEGMKKQKKILLLRAFSSNESSEIINIYSQLTKAGTVDSLIKINTELLNDFSELELHFGDLKDESLEDKLYQLSLKAYTEPIQNENNWFIFELTGIKPNVPEVSLDKFQRDVEEILINRKTRNQYDKFYKKYFGNFRLEADNKIFLKISEEFYNVIASKKNLNKQVTYKYYLTESDILKVKDILGNNFLNQKLFDTKYDPVSVYELLSDLTIVDVIFDEISQPVVYKVLSNELKRFMQQEMVYQIAVEKGIRYSKEVDSQLAFWRENLLAQILKNSYNSRVEVSEGEILNYYDEKFSDSSMSNLINLQSLYTSDLDNIQTIFTMLESGKSFEQITSDLKSNHDVHYENISDLNQLKNLGPAQDIIMDLNVGDIYGPIKTQNGYTIIKVVDQGSISDSLKSEIEKVKNQIHQEIFYKKLNFLIENKTIELANKYGISVSDDFINSEDYSGVNFFVHRYMGFGGRITAFPVVTPFYKWYYQWKSQPEIKP